MARFTFASFFEHMQPDLQLVDAVDNDTYLGSGVDMNGYSGVVFLASVAQGEDAEFNLKVQQDTESDFSDDPQDLEGTNVAFSTDVAVDGFGFVEVRNPAERFLRPVLIAPDLTAATPAAIVAIRYGKGIGDDVNADGELHDAPDEGTA